MGIEEEKEVQVKGMENIFDKMIAKKFPKTCEREGHPGRGGF
jgi:hypothetical protein